MHAGTPHFELCILIPCYNNLAGLQKSLDSIYYGGGQFLIIVVDDGSAQPLEESDLYPHLHDRPVLKLLRLENNQGITAALNTGLRWIRDHSPSTYIARLDCGDICDRVRFDVQMNFLSVNPYVGLLGSWCRFEKPGSSLKFNYKSPLKHGQLRRQMYFRNPFIHPTVIFRLDLVERLGYYPAEYPHAEDYALFWKIINAAPTAIIPSYLVVCEINPDGISLGNRIKQLDSRLVIIRHFGRTFVWRLLGEMKIRALLLVPYSLVANVKKLMSS